MALLGLRRRVRNTVMPDSPEEDTIAPLPLDSDAKETTAELPGAFLNPAPIPAGSEYFQNSPNGSAKPDDISWGDWMLKPGRPLSSRHKKLAEYLTTGMTNKEIAERLGYTEGRISVLRSNTQLLAEADRIRDRFFDKSIGEHVRDLQSDALRNVEEMLTSPAEKLKDRVEASKWLIEMVGGKAKQQLTHEAGSSILDLLKRLDQITAGTPEAAREVLEIEKKKEPDWMDTWVAEQKAGGKNE